MSQEIKKYPYVIKGVPQVCPNVHKYTPLFSNVVVAGNLVFVSGQTAMDGETGVCLANTMEAQMEIVMTKLEKALVEAGSSMENMIKTFILMKDMKDYPVMRASMQDYWSRHAPALLESPPASTVIQGAALARPYYLVEIEAIGVLNEA